MLGAFTFSDGAEPQGYVAVTASGLKMSEKFKFNNSAMFSNKKDPLTFSFFELGDDNFRKFVGYMQEKNALPISLNATKQLLAERK